MTKQRFEKGPYLLTALLCEKVLLEADQAKSAIRIVDEVKPQALKGKLPKKMKFVVARLDLLIRFKSGSARGKYLIEVRGESPTGKETPMITHTHDFEGPGDRGVDIVSQLLLRFKREGLHWFNVYLNKTRVTRIPFRVHYSSALKSQSQAKRS